MLDGDGDGVAVLAGTFGDLHDSVLRAFACRYGASIAVTLDLDAPALDGTWWRLSLDVVDVTELRVTEGVAIWANKVTALVGRARRQGIARPVVCWVDPTGCSFVPS
jgi:hypothetical protein